MGFWGPQTCAWLKIVTDFFFLGVHQNSKFEICLTKRKIWVTFNEIRAKDLEEKEWTRKRREIRIPWSVTLTLTVPNWVIGTAHSLTEGKIWVKFKKNIIQGLGDMDQTLN